MTTYLYSSIKIIIQALKERTIHENDTSEAAKCCHNVTEQP